MTDSMNSTDMDKIRTEKENHADNDGPGSSKKKTWKSFTNFGRSDKMANDSGMEGKQGNKDTGGNLTGSAQNVPTTYPEMFRFNAAVMGFGASAVWMNEILDVFHNIVTNVSNSSRLQEECDVLALRIDRSQDKTD